MARHLCFLGLSIICQLLSSSALANTCDECSRAPTLCRRISGLYTVTVLTEGTYNPVVVIPAQACSINITEFSASSNYIAVKTEKGRGIVNSYWKTGQPGQYDGAGTRFLYDKESTTCKGSCIYSEGPTNEPIVVQVLYYAKNPGIAYEFILPNDVPFTPFDGTFSKQNTASESEVSSSLPTVRYQQGNHQRRHRQHRLHHDIASPSNASDFEGEYYTGTQFSRSEGRPDTTSALQAHIGVKHVPHVSKTQPGTYDYTGSRYGSHTLGGRGMSYTYPSEESQSQEQDYIDRTTGRHVVKRIRSGSPNVLRKAVSPHYVPPTDYRSAPSYAAQPRYQSFSSASTYLNENNNQHVDGNYLRTLNSQTSLGQGQSYGSSQYTWKISGLTECSQTCGGGVQRTNIVCVSTSSRTQVVVTPENCANNLKPRVQTVECNNSPCEPAWEAEEWSECSVTCGSGTQSRIVECRQRFSSTLTLKVSADQCRQVDKPAIAQQCEKELCTQWKMGPWGECSRECGGGERRRVIRCVDKYESQIPVSYCTGISPTEVESCNTQPCQVQWWLSDWSQDCSESCGQGVKSRTALCVNNRGEVVSDNLCDKRDLQNTQKACRSDAGCRGSWFAGAWDKCSTDCGEGKRTRPVICMRRSVGSLTIVRDEECDVSIKPESEETCINTICNSVWYTSSWSECSVSCGEGFRTREVRCFEDNRRQSLRCPSSSKPDSHEACILAQCSRNQPHRTSRNDLNTGYIGRSIVNTSEDQKEFSSRDDENDMVEDVEGENHKHLTSTRTSRHRTSDNICKDTYWNCLMVTQARLCSYDYYRQLCCQSCQKV